MTIYALSSGPGISGIAVIRVSGKNTAEVVKKLTVDKLPRPRVATLTKFNKNGGKELIDEGVIIWFPAPNSYTGEDLAEFHVHGSRAVVNAMHFSISKVKNCRLAEPGEFTKRAFLNGKMDLVQAEAVQDLIQASSDKSALSAVRSLSGEFSKKINHLLRDLIDLRVFVEATIDFSDEEIDFLESHEASTKLEVLKKELLDILDCANQGAILRDGLHVAIVGKPNAGKSSLLNALTKQPSAIVTDIAGTTRDVLKETIHIDGMPLHIIDTAGLHKSDNIIEQEGIRRAHAEINNADVVLLVYEVKDSSADPSILPDVMMGKPIIAIRNKIDLLKAKAEMRQFEGQTEISLSAKFGDGIELLRQALSDIAGYNPEGDSTFLARKRHIVAIESTLISINSAIEQLEVGASELVAEDLRQAGMSLSMITGEFSSDDLLGEIFSSFCIGK